MGTPSRKHQLFVSEPMRGKSVNSLPGIGAILGRRLELKGFDKANNVLGKFLVLNKDRERFIEWLMEASSANPRQARWCYDCLKEWCENFL